MEELIGTTEAVIDDYYNTTAARGHRRALASYERYAKVQGRRLAARVRKYADQPAVDLACGTGELLFCLRRLGFTDLTGVDLSAGVLAAARAFVSDAQLVQEDVLTFLQRSPPRSFGLITAMNIVEHLPKQTLLSFFSLVHRALRPGGQFLMVVPNALSPYGTIPRYWDITHELSFSPNSVRQLAAAAKFTEDPVFFEVGPIPHGLVSMVRWLAWAAIRQNIRLRLMIESGSARGTVFTQDMLVSLTK